MWVGIITKYLSQNIRLPGRYSNIGPQEYREAMIIRLLVYLISELHKTITFSQTYTSKFKGVYDYLNPTELKVDGFIIQ
jgi:hypothetical protein